MAIIAKYKFNQSIYENLIPTFNSDFTDYTYTDEIDTDGHTIRTISNDSGSLPTNIVFKNSASSDIAKSLLSVEYVNTGNLTTMENMFLDCVSLVSVNASSIDTTNIRDMSGMFRGCSSLTNLDLSSWKTSQVTDMGYLFIGCSKLTSLNLSNWDTSQVTTMEYMFNSCKSLTTLDLTSFNTGQVSKSSNMFGAWTSDQTVYISSGWTLGENFPPTFKSPSMVAKYRFTSTTDTLPNFNSGYAYTVSDEDNGDGTTTRTISSASGTPTSMKFEAQTGLLEVLELDISGLTSLENMFRGTSNCTAIHGIENWDTSKIKSLASTFRQSGVTSIDLSRWDVSSVTTFYYMCFNTKLTSVGDLTNWDVSSATTMNSMFDTTSLTTLGNISSWNVSKVTNFTSMFANSKFTSLDISNWTYNETTTSNISFSGMFTRCSSLIEIIGIEKLPVHKTNSLQTLFYNCSKMSSFNIKSWDVSNITNLNQIFRGCSSITTLDLSSWNIEKVTTMERSFSDCTNLETLNLSEWNTTLLTDMDYTFSGCSKLKTLNLSKWNTSALTSTTSIFANANALTNVVMYECSVDTVNTMISLVPNKTSSSYGIVDVSLSEDELSNIDTATATSKMWNIVNRFLVAKYKMQADSDTLPNSIKPTDYIYADVYNNNDGTVTRTIYNTDKLSAISFINKTGLLEVLELDITSKITNLGSLFDGCTNLTSINTTNWDTQNVTSMLNMFKNCSLLTSLDLSGFNTNKVGNTGGMFNGCKSLTSLDLSNWNTEKNSSMASMFGNCQKLTSLNISHFNTANVTAMNNTFQSCSSLTSLNISNWNTEKATTLAYAFSGCSSLTSLNISNWNVGKVSNMGYTFQECDSLTSLDLSNWDVQNVTNMTYLFFNCKSLTSLNISNWNTQKNTNALSMFQYCSSLTSLELSNWNVQNVTTMRRMFSGCSSLMSLDLSNFITDKVDNTSEMFSGCSSLTSLNLSRFNTENATNIGSMFNGCKSLTSLDLSSFNTEQVTNMGAIFQNCTSLAVLDLSNWNTINATSMGSMFASANKLTDIGLLYSNESTINMIANSLPKNAINVYYYDADETQLIPVNKVTFLKYVFPTSMQLPPHIELRSLVDGSVRDEVDLSTGILTRRIGLDTNGYPYELEEPIQEQLILNNMNTCDYGIILPTGVQDKYNVVTNEYYQTMETIALDGKNVWLEMEDLGSVLKFTATGETVEIEELNMLGAGGLYCDNNLFPNINDDSDVEHCRVDEEGNKFYIYISKERLMSPDVIGYQVWLQQNKFNMTYELAVHQNIIKPYEELDPTQAKWDTLNSVRDSMVYLISTDVNDDFIITPTLEYVAPSSNNFYLDLLTPNTEYTIYAEGINEEIDTINLGGITTPYTRACLMTSGDNKWITFDNNETFDKVMIIKGNSQNEFIGYFKGIGNIDNPTITIVNEDESQQSQVSYPDVHLRSLPTGERDHFDAILGTVTQNVGVRPFEDGDLENMDLITDGINTLYPLTEPITQYVTPKPLLAYDNGKIKITSDTGLVTTLTYAVPFSNTYRLPHLKTGTLYTIKYPSASGTITIGDITYSITSNSMLFTTPLVINGDTSAIIFSDENPQNVILLEGGYSNREVAYFAGIKSVSNPIITIIDNTVENPENVEYKPTNEIELRSLPNGVADLLDIVKQKVTISVGYRHYQEGDEYLDNVWTDGYNTAYALEDPVVRDVKFVTPVISTNSTMKLSSNGLIPQLNYRVPSTNNFPLDLLLPNTTYTLYGQADTPITYSLGGVYNSTLMGAEVISLGNTNNNLLTFNGDISSADVMLVKGDTTRISVPYFQGVKSVNNIDFIIEGLQGEQNTMSLQNNVSLRACGNIKDSIDMTTCILTRELGEVVLRGNESWFSLEEVESINVDYVLFGCIVGGATNSQSTSVICNRFNHKYLSGSLHQQECVYCTDNQVRICIKKTTIGGNNITALKTWLGQNNVSVIYALRTPLSEKLTSVWETMPPTSYNNQTVITTQPHSNTPKPMITITVATTTLEQIISELQSQNTQLENENVTTMMALTSFYETFAVSTISDGTSTINLSDGKDSSNLNGMSISPMSMIYAKLIKKGLKTIEQVPTNLQAEVKYVLKE